ncbi:transposase [Deinococcus hopiensis]|uniref:transposase n=1 Tax=Deinococcus hopiensis TaxID=309885 RepID=UPI003CCC13E2
MYAFVNPESGESRFWLVPVLNKEADQAVMAAFAQRVGAGENLLVLVVQDGGGFHVPAPQGQPEGIETVTLPPYSPELQPVERLWALTDHTVANRCFDTRQDFTETLAQQCAWLETQPDLLSQHTLFHWWPLLRNESESVLGEMPQLDRSSSRKEYRGRFKLAPVSIKCD